jgi:glutamate synthase domain-containing protein 3
LLRECLLRHARFSGSTLSMQILRAWQETLPHFVRVMPNEYKATHARTRRDTINFSDRESHGRSERVPVLSAG